MIEDVLDRRTSQTPAPSSLLLCLLTQGESTNSQFTCGIPLSCKLSCLLDEFVWSHMFCTKSHTKTHTHTHTHTRTRTHTNTHTHEMHLYYLWNEHMTRTSNHSPTVPLSPLCSIAKEMCMTAVSIVRPRESPAR